MALALCAGACQGPQGGGTLGETRLDPLAATGPEVLGQPGLNATHGRAIVELGAYAGDGRIVATAAEWPVLVDRAVAALPRVTGLAFPPTKPPRVRLAPLGNERLDFEIASRILEGRRIPMLTVNVEPLAAGRRDVETVLLRGLAAAVFEDASHRLGTRAAYVLEAAGIVAAGDLEDRFVRLARASRGTTPTVDPDDPRAARATAAAAVLLLRENGGEAMTQRFLRFTAEGDDPNELIARAVHDPLGRWAGRGRSRLASRLAKIDVRPWQMLDRARRTLREEGRGAMDSVLPASLPPSIAPEITVLRAQAFADEGDYESVRRLLTGMKGVARLQDPGAAAALRIRAERATGGDAALADQLETWWRRDYPRLAAETPAAKPGVAAADDDLMTIRGRIAALLESHKAGAASRFLAGLGERALAPELADVQRAVVDAESKPAPEAVEVNRRRVRTWRSKPDSERAAAVRAGGAAGAIALAEVLPPNAGPSRRQAIRLLGETGGTGRAVELLGPVWKRRPSLLRGDLDALLAVATWPELRVWVQGVAGDVRGVDTAWAQLRYGIDEGWVREQPQVLSDLRSDAYPVRRRAFDTVAEAGEATPALVAQGLRDPAPLLRRRAAEVAGHEAYPSLIRVALKDDAWMVRQAGCAAAARGSGREAVGLLLNAYRSDPATSVRLAAATGLFELEAPGSVLAALVAGLSDPEPAVRDLVAARLPGLDPERVVPAVIAALESEARRPEMRGPVLARLFLVLQRSSRRQVRYVPGMSREEVQTLLTEIRRWAGRSGR